MPPLKACIPCASSKRKCDRQLPGCERCLKREIECVYPQRKKRRRDENQKHFEEAIEPNFGEPDVVDILENIDTTDWNWNDANALDLITSLYPSDLITTALPSLDSTPTLLEWPLANVPQDTVRPWYLQKDTWELRQHQRDPTCTLEVNYEPYVIEVKSMLRLWSMAGHNEFIHQKLYENSMPRYVQEAFTMLAAYFHCQPNMKSAVLQIAEDQSCRLIEQELSKHVDSQRVLRHLARVHALFAYVFVRLFDGSVRLRASAERQLPVLRSWAVAMIEEAGQLDGIRSMTDTAIDQQDLSVFGPEFRNMSEQWNMWLIAESVRRTYIIVNTILNVYLCLSVGQAECSGFLMLTARHGLWQAESASRWSRIVSSKSPLLIPIVNPGHLISESSASDFDEILLLLWKYMVGPEKIQHWIENGKNMSV